jgi:hypothetical protein
MTFVTFVPWRAIDKYRNFRGMRADIRALADSQHFDGDLVLIRGTAFPDYASAVVLNPIRLDGPGTIYAFDRDADVRSEVQRAYGTRRTWFVDGPSVTGAGYHVREGPNPPAAPPVSSPGRDASTAPAGLKVAPGETSDRGPGREGRH